MAIAPEETYWWCAYDLDGPWSGVPSLSRVRTLADAFPGVVATVVEDTDPEDLIVTPLADLPALPRWSRGSVALLGDAAHAMTPNLGQGGAQAIEDALVLSRILEGNASAGPEAFRAYEKALIGTRTKAALLVKK